MNNNGVISEAYPAFDVRQISHQGLPGAQDPSSDCFARWEDDGGRVSNLVSRFLAWQQAPLRRYA